MQVGLFVAQMSYSSRYLGRFCHEDPLIAVCADDAGSQEERGALHVVAVLNPLSKAAQRMAPILEWLRSSLNASVKVHNPSPLDSNLPVFLFLSLRHRVIRTLRLLF